MQKQNVAFEEIIKHTELALLFRICHYNSEFDAYYENYDPECVERDVDFAYTMFCEGWKAATLNQTGNTNMPTTVNLTMGVKYSDS